MSKSFLNQPNLSRGLRNNNPGNLIKTSIQWQGKIPHSQNPDSRFEQFIDVHWGIRAMMLDLINDYKKGKTSVKLLIKEYAPSFENNTQAYINTVIGIVGKNEIQVLDKKTLIDLSKAIHYVENGPVYYHHLTTQDFEIAFNLLPNFTPIKKKAI